MQLFEKFEKSLISYFGAANIKYDHFFGKKKKTYDYSNSHIHIQTAYDITTDKWLDPKISEILKADGFVIPELKAFIQYTEIISKGEPKQPYAEIYVKGNNYKNNVTKIDLNADIKSQIVIFLDKVKSSKINEDIMYGIFSGWKSMKYDKDFVSSSDVGIGIHASSYHKYKFESVYNITNLEDAFDFDRNGLEDYIKKFYRFKRDTLKFDWDEGLMYVNGTYTEHWD